MREYRMFSECIHSLAGVATWLRALLVLCNRQRFTTNCKEPIVKPNLLHNTSIHSIYGLLA